ncbi:MAG: benzoate-CoA ligase family protein [Acidimicrobiales bacterium]
MHDDEQQLVVGRRLAAPLLCREQPVELEIVPVVERLLVCHRTRRVSGTPPPNTSLTDSLNIAGRFLTDRVAEGRGDRVAIRLANHTYSYADVDRLANRFGNALRALDVRQEERVLLSLPDGVEYVAALFGILKLGAVAVMVNPDLPPDGMAAMAGRSRARVAVVSLDGARPPVQHQLTVPPGAAPPGSDELDVVPTHPDDPAIWLFSGGTTGWPKAVVQTHASFANTTELYARRAMGWCADDITLSVPKLYFGYATGSNLFFPFSVGASTALYPEHPTAEVVFDQIARFRPTILVNTPKMVADMVAHPAVAGQNLSCLRFATSAGEALPPSLYDRWRDTFGVDLYDGLGTAEMWHVFVSNQPGAVRPGSLGRPVEGFDVRVRGADGRDLPDGEVGRLWVRGGSRALGYWQDQVASADAFRGEWFVAGDLVRRDDDGYLHYVGRSDDALKVSGKWLLPVEVEDCLASHAEVEEAAVVGVPDAAGLLKPMAFVVTASGRSDLEEELKQHCLARLDPYKHPRRVVVVPELPRTHLGNICPSTASTMEIRPPLDSQASPTVSWSTSPHASGSMPSASLHAAASCAGSTSSPYAGYASRPPHSSAGAAGGAAPVPTARATDAKTSYVSIPSGLR